MTSVYLRVSTSDQNISMQLREIEAFLLARGMGEFKIYQDEGFSGKNASRPALKQLLADVKLGGIKTIVIWKLDRLGRSLADLLSFIKVFSEHGASLISVKDNLDLSTSQGMLFMQLLGAFAEFERSMIVERTKSGLANAKAKGILCGRPSNISVSSKETMLKLTEQGWSKNRISRELGINIGSVYHFLTTVKKLNTNIVQGT